MEMILFNSQSNLEKNNFSKKGISEEYLQDSQNLEQKHEIMENDVNFTLNTIKESNKLFETAKTNKMIYSNSSNNIRRTEQEEGNISKFENHMLSVKTECQNTIERNLHQHPTLNVIKRL